MMAGAEGFVLACRLGRCFCFAEVSTGDPFSPAGSVSASASQRCPPDTRTPRHAPRASKIKSFTQTKKKKSRKTTLFLFGRGRRIRTLGTRFWRPLLYQLSYTPILVVLQSTIILYTLFMLCQCFLSNISLKI